MITVSKKFLAHAELMQKGLRKDRAKKFRWREKNLRSDLILSKCWPKDGTPQLLSIIKKSPLPWLPLSFRLSP
jgi:hypothetical protein